MSSILTLSGVGAGGLPTPPTAQQPVGWYRAHAQGLANDAPVDQWTDESGAGNHLTQTGSARPLCKTNVLNGYSTFRFDGVNDGLLRTGITSFASATGVTFFAVAIRVGSGSFWQAVSAINTAETLFNELRLDVTSVFWQFVSGLASVPSTSAVVPTTNWQAMFGRFRDSNDQVLINVGGVDAPAGSDVSAISINRLAVGMRAGAAGSLFLSGDLAEVMLYNTPLSDGDASTVLSYLLNKYAL